jgi:hypothetical protein
MKNFKNAKADFRGFLKVVNDERNPFSHQLFSPEFDELNNDAHLRLKRNFRAELKAKAKNESSIRRHHARKSQGPQFFFRLFDNRYYTIPKEISIEDLVEDIHWQIKDKPHLLEEWPQLKRPRYIRQHANSLIEEKKVALKALEKRKAEYLSIFFREMESSLYCGKLKLDGQGLITGNIQEVVTDFIMKETFLMPTLGDYFGKRIWLNRDYSESKVKGGSEMVSLSIDDLPAIVNTALFYKIRKTLGLLWTLTELGDNGALLKIAKTLIPNINALNNKMNANPESLGKWPQQMPAWPVMVFLHKEYKSDPTHFLKKIHVGKALPFRFDENARWEKNIITTLAFRLYEKVNGYRSWAGSEDCDLPNPLQKRLSELQAFSSDTWQAWWEVTKEVLEYEYDDLAIIPELQAWANSDKDRGARAETGRSRATSYHQKPPSQIRKFIYRALKEKFGSLAGANKLK